MFEYLMPSLIMRAPKGSLLEQTSRLIVRRQIDYATRRRLPWGISESAYNVRDLEFTYQYSSFGVPGLGLKRGLGEDLVVAPYATALATMVDPRAASANLARLAEAGARGRHGFYEALDYTPIRVLEGASVAIVRAYMAHHQGMTIVAIADALFDGAMRERFHAEPIVQATELLLQERTPRDVSVVRPWAAEVKSAAAARDTEPPGGRRFASADQATPATHLLSNGRYATMLTAAGSGYSRWGDLAVTRWREDATCDDFGSYVFIRDVRSGDTWSCGFQPTGVEPDEYDVVFYEDRLGRGRRRGSPRLDREYRQPRAGARDHLLCRARAGAPGRGYCASGLFQVVRRDGILGRCRRHRRDAATTGAERARDMGRASFRRRRRRRGQAGDRDRQSPFPGPRPGHPRADRGHRWSSPLEHGRHRARPGLRAAPTHTASSGRDRARRLLDDGRIDASGAARWHRQA